MNRDPRGERKIKIERKDPNAMKSSNRATRTFLENSAATKLLLKILGVFGVSLVISGMIPYLSWPTVMHCYSSDMADAFFRWRAHSCSVCIRCDPRSSSRGPKHQLKHNHWCDMLYLDFTFLAAIARHGKNREFLRTDCYLMASLQFLLRHLQSGCI